MPKHKSHSGMTKRIAISASGRLRRQKANRRHLLEHKPSTRTRRLAGTTDVHPNDAKHVRRLLGR